MQQAPTPEGRLKNQEAHIPGCLGGAVIERLSSAQGVIPAFRKGVPHWAPPLEACFFLSHSPACVLSLTGCLYLCQMNK